MLISLSHKFIFIANLKTASTSIEKALQRYADVRISHTQWGKHSSLGHAELRFARLFELVARHQFRVLAVMREPMDWLGSLYRSHKHPKFRGTRLNTADMPMAEFLTKWRFENRDQCLPQVSRLHDFHNRFDADFIMRYEKLADDFGEVCDLLGIRLLELSRENVSEELRRDEEVSEDLQLDVRKTYQKDYHVWRNLAGRLLTEKEKANALAVDENFTIPPHIEPANSYPLTREDVCSTFRELLGREPESNKAVKQHRALGTVEALRARIMSSKEYKVRQKQN